MTIKELASKFKKSIGDIYKILASNEIKGYSAKDQLPDDVVKVVVEVLENVNTGMALTPATPSTNKEAMEPRQESNNNELANGIKNRVKNSAGAVSAQVQHINTERAKQEVADAQVLGAIDALNSTLAYQESYAQMMNILYTQNVWARKEALQNVLNEVASPDFLAETTVQESCLKSSKVTATNQLANDLMTMFND
jgi:hypothetical protein